MQTCTRVHAHVMHPYVVQRYGGGERLIKDLKRQANSPSRGSEQASTQGWRLSPLPSCCTLGRAVKRARHKQGYGGSPREARLLRRSAHYGPDLQAPEEEEE